MRKCEFTFHVWDVLNMNLVVTGIRQSSHQLDTLWTSKVQDTLPASLTAAFFTWKDDIHWPVHQDQRATCQLTRERLPGEQLL